MSLKSLLAQLQKDYLASFPGKIVNLRDLQKNGSLEDLKTEYHKLKGTGRTYGLPEVTQVGEALEVLCDHPDLLPIAVPISLALLERIRASRSKGVALKVDDDHEYQVIVELVMGLRKSA